MSAPTTGREPRYEIDLIAPWAVIDRLDHSDLVALERLLDDDPNLADRLEAAADERDETIAVNEALPPPSLAARDRLFAAIEAHEALTAKEPASLATTLSAKPRAVLQSLAPMPGHLMAWLTERVTALSPRTLVWAATAAVLVIALQAGALTGAILGRGGNGGEATYQTASDAAPAPVEAPAPTGLVSFAPSASASDIEKALREAGAEIVGGPKPGGVYVIRVAGAATPDELEPSLKRLRDASGVVTFAAPGGR